MKTKSLRTVEPYGENRAVHAAPKARGMKSVNGFSKAFATSKKARRIAPRQPFSLTFRQSVKSIPGRLLPSSACFRFFLTMQDYNKKKNYRKNEKGILLLSIKCENMSTDFEMKKKTFCCTIVAIHVARLLPNVLYS